MNAASAQHEQQLSTLALEFDHLKETKLLLSKELQSSKRTSASLAREFKTILGEF